MEVVTSNLRDRLAKHMTIEVAMLESREGIEPEQVRFFQTLEEASNSSNQRAESVGRFDIPKMHLNEDALELGIITTDLSPIGHLTITAGLTGIATSPLNPLYTRLTESSVKSLSVFKNAIPSLYVTGLYKVDNSKYLLEASEESFFINLDGSMDDTRFLLKDTYVDISPKSLDRLHNNIESLREGKIKFDDKAVSISKSISFEEANPEFLSKLRTLYEVTD